MNKDLKIDYLRRLFYPFKKDGKLDSFVFHYLQGSGNELKEKFWSPRSSSDSVLTCTHGWVLMMDTR